VNDPHSAQGLVDDELDVLVALVPLAAQDIIELAFNELIRLFNDEGEVRAAAQAALDEALRNGKWRAVAQRRFDMPVRFSDFADFERRMMRPTLADHRIDDVKLASVRAAFGPHCASDGAHFIRPMHVRLLQRV
jgi:hypothetical protein